MAGYKRIVLEVPVGTKNNLDEIVKSRKITIKDFFVDIIQKEYLEMIKVRFSQSCVSND